ncbi:Hsp20/alpha crystallin family protein [Cereibacter sphaeroides]|uniref:Hsp20/alpha crystallin family protein n=1 Tax=Cereibacter sphaeroides TaxID=1063 RepID=UPI001D0EF9D9|nr:Hsp20 family protein [Cereibacter sphaeroides]
MPSARSFWPSSRSRSRSGSVSGGPREKRRGEILRGRSTCSPLRERETGMMQRTFRLPAGVATEAVAARYQNGVLTITLPKTADAREKERKIEVQAA